MNKTTMTTSNNTIGYLELFIGPMYSSKTTSILEVYKKCNFVTFQLQLLITLLITDTITQWFQLTTN
jgi:thymidine kinase